MKNSKLICGAGRNDCSYLVNVCATIGGKKKMLWCCPFYQAWKNMLERCYSKKFQSRYPTYVGCSVSPEWLSFSTFREWMESQDHEGKHLDKDILAPGNKLYGPTTCVFVSPALNNFLTNSSSARGEWPIGVHLDKRRNKFIAQCRNPFTGKEEFLGYFDTPEAAHEAWIAKKHENGYSDNCV